MKIGSQRSLTNYGETDTETLQPSGLMKSGPLYLMYSFTSTEVQILTASIGPLIEAMSVRLLELKATHQEIHTRKRPHQGICMRRNNQLDTYNVSVMIAEPFTAKHGKHNKVL